MFEIKIRKVKDYSKWEELPVIAKARENTLNAVLAALKTDDVYEIRYNEAGSQQGVYIPGRPEARIAHITH